MFMAAKNMAINFARKCNSQQCQKTELNLSHFIHGHQQHDALKVEKRATRRQRTLDALAICTDAAKSTKVHLRLKGLALCITCWSQCVGQHLSTTYRIVQDYQKGQVGAFEPLTGRPNPLSMSAQVKAMLVVWLESRTDQMPTTGARHLVPGTLTKDIYSEIMLDWDETLAPPSLKLFYAITKKTFRELNVKIPATARFQKCEECCQLNEMVKCAKNVVEREEIKAVRSKHLMLQNGERLDYYTSRTRSACDPNFKCIIMDGMDQVSLHSCLNITRVSVQNKPSSRGKQS
jgi:hypothetical protein